MMRRILSVWLPHWPITRLSRSVSASPDRPLVTIETIRGVRHLVAVGVDGEAQGLSPGQTLTAARAVCPALVPVDADPVADEAALARLAAWCERYTPMAAPDPPDGLWLDITGCTRGVRQRSGAGAGPCRPAGAECHSLPPGRCRHHRRRLGVGACRGRSDHPAVRGGKAGAGRSADHQPAARCRHGDRAAPAWPAHGAGTAAHSARADHLPLRCIAGVAAGSGARRDGGSDRLAASADRVA